MKGKLMILPKEAFFALVYFALLQLCGCGCIGWLPSLSLAVAGINRSDIQPDRTDKERVILKAEARLRWRITPTPNRWVSQPTDEQRTAISEVNYRTSRTNDLREWERRERNRTIDATNQRWRQ